MFDHFIDQTIILSLKGRKYLITLDVEFDLFIGLAGVMCQQTRDHFTHTQDLFGHQANVGGLSLCTAGRLVDQCGLKGFRHGDAQISHIHANIMVNLGHATAKDVRELISIAQKAVDEKFGHRLEPEIGFVGEFDATSV